MRSWTYRRPTVGQLRRREPGPHGVTLRMLAHGRAAAWRTVEPAPKVERDRRLAGKARVAERRRRAALLREVAA